jgi:DNA replication protein DnaC
MKTVRVDELYEKWKKNPDYRREYDALENEFTEAAKQSVRFDSHDEKLSIAASSTIDIDRLRTIAGAKNRYQQQLNRLSQSNKEISSIEEAVSKAMHNISLLKTKSFVIYGEPQTGKTEMMICLTAKLIDDGFNIAPIQVRSATR